VKYRVKSICKTCDACPAQWSGRTVDGKTIYIRYRWGGFRIEIDGHIVSAVYTEEPFAGAMSNEEMIEMTTETLDFSEAQWVESTEAL